MSGSRDDTQKAAASAAAQQNQQTAGAYNNTAQNLYGSVASNTAAMANPESLNVTSPTGPSKLQYDQAVQNTAQQYQNASGQLSRSMALRGFGANSPSGMQAALQGQLGADEANAQGANFSNYTNQAYQNAYNNFWNANQLNSQNAGQQGQFGTQGGDAAANTYANLYANSYKPSPWATVGQIAGGAGAAALGGGGAITKVL